ncbi:MAG TPA: response regulator [Candidatus Dormibacteraeota bacterium]|jgi:DNA-binding response OmpR family regulator
MTGHAAARVLIVDDDAANRSVLRLACETVGVDVVEAGTGAVALERAGAGGLALILLDLGLPDISGLEVCRRLRRAGVATPIIVVSAYSGPDQVEIGLAAGADDYIGKPYRLATLLARIQVHARPVDDRVQLPGVPALRRPARRPRRHELIP